MKDYTIQDLSLAIVGIVGAVGSLCLIIFKSRCTRVKMGCVEIDRKVMEKVDIP